MSKIELWAGVSKSRQQRIKRTILKEERERLRGEIEGDDKGSLCGVWKK